MNDPGARSRVEAIWGRYDSLQAHLYVSVDESYARALTAARLWFDLGFARLGGVFHEAVLRSAPAELDVMARISGCIPGAISIQMTTMLNKQDGFDAYVTYSPQAWEEMLLSLGRVPYLTTLQATANDSDGDSLTGPYIAFAVRRVDSGGGTWLQLGLQGSAELFVPEPRQAALLDVLRTVADQANPVHGEVAWGKAMFDGVYERATSSSAEESLPKARRALCGYAWITILPEEIGRRLGGLEALRTSGAFVEVEPLSAGGYWCRATPGIEDYDQAGAERVFDVVAPALPPGSPNMWQVIPPNVLSPRDPGEPNSLG